jgi:hypothetical protein
MVIDFFVWKWQNHGIGISPDTVILLLHNDLRGLLNTLFKPFSRINPVRVWLPCEEHLC